MKRFFSLTGLALVFMSFSFQSDIESMLMDLKFGNVDQVANRFYDYIDLKLPGEDGVNINRNQAKNLLKIFFNKNGIKGFEKESDRSDGSTKMITGRLPNGANGFNISIVLRQISGRNVILAIRIN
ncbi:MAG TPA: hypothetical protein DIT07_10560 [Sphingobacteriaceae bacterium]|nr:hypothetical protein [Sphingobacteriaceae bacterium]